MDFYINVNLLGTNSTNIRSYFYCILMSYSNCWFIWFRRKTGVLKEEPDMSSELNVKLKRKGYTYAESPTLLSLTTTPTRDLCEKVSLVYDGNKSAYDMLFESGTKKDSKEPSLEYGPFTVLTESKLDEIIQFYDDKLKQYSELCEEWQTKVDTLEKRIRAAENREVYDRIEEDLLKLHSVVAEITDAIEELEYYRNYWMFGVKFVLSANTNWSETKNDYELIYYRD